MTKTSTLAGAALAAIVLSAVAVQAGPLFDTTPPISSDGPVLVDMGAGQPTPTYQPHPRGMAVAIACHVAGTPSEFPDDLYLVNQGNSTIPAGTRIKWEVKSSGRRGYLGLSSDLAAGDAFRVNGVLGGGAEAGVPCTARAI